MGSFVSPLSTLISGFGFGGVLVLLASMFNPEKTVPLQLVKKREEIEEEDDSEEKMESEEQEEDL